MRLLLLLSLFLILFGCVDSGSSFLDDSKTTVGSDVGGVSKEKDGQRLSNNVEEGVVEITVKAKQFEFIPNEIRVKKGQLVRIRLESLDVAHGFALPAFNINVAFDKNNPKVVEFVANKTGVFEFYCSVYCGEGHNFMTGKLIVE